MTVGKKIEQYRKDLKLSQEELANKLFVSRQTVSQWENDQTSPTIDNFLRLCEVFSVSMNDFFEDKAPAADKLSEYEEQYKWKYSDDDLNIVFRVIRKKDIVNFWIVLITEFILLIIAMYFQIWWAAVLVIAFLIRIVSLSSINTILYKKKCKAAKDTLSDRMYHIGVASGFVYITVFDDDGQMISFDKIYPVNIEKRWNTEDLYIFQYKQRRYIIKKDDLNEKSQIGDLLGF